MQKSSAMLVLHTTKLQGKKKKKKKKLKKNKINISVLHKYYKRCTVKVLRYIVNYNPCNCLSNEWLYNAIPSNLNFLFVLENIDFSNFLYIKKFFCFFF